MSSIKLNIFQRGALQKCAVCFAYMASFAIGTLVLYWMDTQLFYRFVERVKQRDIFSMEPASGLAALIEARDHTVILSFLFICFCCIFVGWLFMRWAAKRNWSLPVTLPKAVEFRTAMRKLGVTTPEDEIAFVQKHKLPVFIACSPFRSDEQENVRSQFYAFAHHSTFSEADVFERHIGKKTLCLNLNDYGKISVEGKKHSSLGESVSVAEKDEEIKNLRDALSSATQENKNLIAERDDLRGKLNIQDAQEVGRIDRLRKERLQWAALTPVVERLISEAPAGKIYTMSEIENAFTAEWAQRTDLREQMVKLTGNETTTPSGSMYDAIKEELEAAGLFNKKGGRPRKNPKGQG